VYGETTGALVLVGLFVGAGPLDLGVPVGEGEGELALGEGLVVVMGLVGIGEDATPLVGLF